MKNPLDKFKNQSPDQTDNPEAAQSWPKEASPYAGFSVDRDTGKATGRAPCGPMLMVLGGPGAGKTRRDLVPQILTWDGPVVAVSAKSDLAEMSASIRAQRGGPMYLMDLTGQADWSALPEGMIAVDNDPCALLTPDADGSTDDSALDLANLLLQVGTLGMGGGKGGGGDSAFWMTLAQGVLACLLQAGAGYPDADTGDWVTGGGIAWVLKAALNPGDSEDADTIDLDTPSWDVAAARADLLDSEHVAEIDSTKALDPKQRDSVSINLRVALGSWKKRSVRGKGTGAPFTPTMLKDPNATFYLISPSSGSAAGAATSVIESLVAHWTLNAIKRKLPKIAMVIDECPQICPIPRLDEHVALMRSYGMHFTVAAQNSMQFAEKFGETKMKVLTHVFPSILVCVGAVEDDLLNRVAWTVPRTERRLEGDGESFDRIEAHGNELLPRHPGEGRLIQRGLQGQFVKLLDYTEM